MSAELQSVGIALDIIDTLADDSELGVTELAPARGRRQEHRPPHVRDARRTWTPGPHNGPRLPARPAPRRARQPGH